MLQSRYEQPHLTSREEMHMKKSSVLLTVLLLILGLCFAAAAEEAEPTVSPDFLYLCCNTALHQQKITVYLQYQVEKNF